MEFLTKLHAYLAYECPQPGPWPAKWVDRLIARLETI